ncbi:cell division protein ZipA C-terminal FtsZ-binding domain-containing protein [Deefgea tanakiae]|uniref:Cell division protein ZipA n=1 Tax=Deefgea tanakiae TaxID=2865840 RepID=A0ABX8ZD42_9NEIS|nr:cell division protein ZipA C-terminal FtsZ-binding domain-containing protein [Deefgea tanakiae]QZA79214.1 cell division protein ZipA C-terminal FtsZ-binding domain-containing protein [Deefgea tanakiae]
MTELQIYSLVGAGGFVAAVYGFNWWQEYRYRKQANKAFARNQPDALLNTPKNMVRKGDGQRLEPILEPTAAPESAAQYDEARLDRAEYDVPELSDAHLQAAQQSQLNDDIPDDMPDMPPAYRSTYTPKIIEDSEPAFDTEPEYVAAAEQAAIEPTFKPAPVQADVNDEVVLAGSLLDPSLDFIAELHAPEPISAADIPPFPATKRVQVLGLNQNRQWEMLNSTTRGRFKELRIGLQMADRQGALTPENLNAFCMGVQQFSDDLDASVTFPQKSAKLNLAKELDEFCASVDVLIGLNIPAGARPLPMEKVRVLAEQAGMVRHHADGTFQYRSDSGKTLFVLANQDQSPLMSTSQGLTLLFDVPRVAGGLAVFDYLADFAQNLATALHCELVDDNYKPLNAASLANIRKQLAGLYADMDDRGIAPGSVAALRLFA